MDGIGRAGAYSMKSMTEMVKSGALSPLTAGAGIPEYTIATSALARIKEHLYGQMEIREEPTFISFKQAVEKHMYER